jgi:hypothetical protein
MWWLWSSQLPCNYPDSAEWICLKVEVHLKITECLEVVRILTEPSLTIEVLHFNLNFSFCSFVLFERMCTVMMISNCQNSG